jgi:NADH dehydrogenase
METWLRVAADPLVHTGRTRVFGRGDNQLNLVSVRDVARFVEVALLDPALRGATLEIGGPENVSMNQLIATVERLAGRTGRIDHVPVPALRLMSVLLRPFRPGLAGMIGASIVMDTRDMRFDASTTAQHFPSIPPTSLDTVVRERYRTDLQASRDAAREGSRA